MSLRYSLDRKYMEDGIDFDARRIYFEGDVETEAIGYVIRAIQRMIEYAPNAPITIFINTPGGEVSAALSFYDYIRSCSAPIHAIAIGEVMSAGILMLLACDKRSSYPSTRFMDHDHSLGIGGTDEAVQAEAKESKALKNYLLDIYVDRSKLNKRQWLSRIRGKNFYFVAKEAQTIGIIDEITHTTLK